jgi:alginate O-acetyltransferase complex protein AlgI
VMCGLPWNNGFCLSSIDMLFNSVTFLLFFCWVLLVHFSPLPWRLKKLHLLLASYVFYAAWNPPFILLLWLSTWVDWLVARKMAASEEPRTRRHWLWLSLTVNLGMLVVFKYAGFLLSNFNALIAVFGVQWQATDPGLILPMGISFFTFQTLSYTLDVYHRRMQPWDRFLDYALFVSFFPQLVAGPIVRAREFLPQLVKQQPVTVAVFSTGLCLFIFGLFQKTVMADTLFAPQVDLLFAHSGVPDVTSAWLGSLFFSAQIFCDFSGYSMCAIGVALCLGLRLPVNFRSPFAAQGFSDFWRRWHISLSSWLRDYLYIAMGGNRHGRWRRYRNLMVTMLLGGLWHGAAWTFVLWGALHGAYLVIEQLLKRLFGGAAWANWRLTRGVIMLLTFVAVMLAFVVFRAQDMHQVSTVFAGLVGLGSSGSQPILVQDIWLAVVTVAFVLLLLTHVGMSQRDLNSVLAATPAWIRGVVLAVLVGLIVLAGGASDAFIYFQF